MSRDCPQFTGLHRNMQIFMRTLARHAGARDLSDERMQTILQRYWETWPKPACLGATQNPARWNRQHMMGRLADPCDVADPVSFTNDTLNTFGREFRAATTTRRET